MNYTLPFQLGVAFMSFHIYDSCTMIIPHSFILVIHVLRPCRDYLFERFTILML
jgi:hypothetical protein